MIRETSCGVQLCEAAIEAIAQPLLQAADEESDEEGDAA